MEELLLLFQELELRTQQAVATLADATSEANFVRNVSNI
jgi:hypothetical protein